MFKYLCIGLLALTLAACARGDTPKQKAYDVVGKAEAALIIVRDVVQDERTSPTVKKHLKLASQAVTDSVGAYVAAAKAGGSTAATFQEAVKAVTSLVGYLVKNGYMGKTATGLPVKLNWRTAA